MEFNNENYIPKKNKRLVSKDVVYKLAAMMCSNAEIGEVLGLSPSTIKQKYHKVIEEGRSQGKKSLRQAQMEKALAGDVRMLIFLGKQYLGQTDSGDQGEDNQPLPWEEAE